MQKFTAFKTGAIIITGLIVAACSSPSTQAPTHRWASTESVDSIQYRNDNARCQAQANMANANRELETDSSAFSEYKQCMNNRGYVLTAYNE